MQLENEVLIRELLSITDKAIASAQKLKTLHAAQLNFKQSPPQWSALECLEHLNLYGDFYLPEIEKQILAKDFPVKSTVFKSGLMGNYFANLMRVKDGKLTKMKSPKDKNPANSQLSVTTVDRFIKQLEWLRSLLTQAEKTDLTKTKTAISLTPFIRLRLGDTLRFYTFHIERHVIQAEKSVHASNESLEVLNVKRIEPVRSELIG